MRLQAGYRFRGAPQFHRAFAWPDRIRLNGGVNAADPALSPRPDWRPATAEELSLLVDDTDGEAAAAADPAGYLQAFSLPRHLHERWWELADQLAAGPMEELPAYQTFAREVASFLGFKGLPLPPRCTFDVVLAPAGAAPDRPPMIALINLGGGPASLVFVNLPPARLAQLLQEQAADPGVVRRFLIAFPDYPLVRLTLGPAEGIWLPPAGGIFQNHPAEDGGLEVWLALRPGGA
jgi:hypothetical protein